MMQNEKFYVFGDGGGDPKIWGPFTSQSSAESFAKDLWIDSFKTYVYYRDKIMSNPDLENDFENFEIEDPED